MFVTYVPVFVIYNKISPTLSPPEMYSDNLPTSCFDYAKIQYGGSYHDNMVDDVRTLGKICVIFMAMIPYWIVYFQVRTADIYSQCVM